MQTLLFSDVYSRVDRMAEACRDSLVRDIRDLVRIRSIKGSSLPGMPYGEGPAAALDRMLEKCAEMGFRTGNLDRYAGYADYGEGPYTMAVLTHLDTVPVGDGWTRDPFGGEFEDGKVYGRGSYDDKGPAAAVLHALSIVRDLGFAPKGKIRLIFGTDEESGMQDMVHYLSREPEPDMAFSPDARFPVISGEKGILDLGIDFPVPPDPVLVRIQGGTGEKKVPESADAFLKLGARERRILGEAYESFPDADRVRIETGSDPVIVYTSGRAAPASMPGSGENAVSVLMDFLGTLDFWMPETASFIQSYNRIFGYDTTGSSCGCGFRDALGSALTLNVARLSAEPGSCGRMAVQIRYPVQSDGEQVVRAVRSACSGAGWSVRTDRHMPPLYHPDSSPLVSTLLALYRLETGDKDAQPVWISGGTYARTLRNAVAFGSLFPGMPQLAHEADEFVNINNLIRALRLYAKAMLELGCVRESPRRP